LTTRVLLADDHPGILERISGLLSCEFTVVATASNGVEMMDAWAMHRPDVVVTDVTMPGLTGIEASQKILEACPRTPIVVLSVYTEREVVQRALSAGAMAYVHKLSAGEDLIPAIRSVLNGRRFVSDTCKLAAN
jgi:DNA-binding NarL/FixJ family response regulator